MLKSEAITFLQFYKDGRISTENFGVLTIKIDLVQKRKSDQTKKTAEENLLAEICESIGAVGFNSDGQEFSILPSVLMEQELRTAGIEIRRVAAAMAAAV